MKGIAFVKQRSGKGHAGTAEQVLGPHSLLTLDDKGACIAAHASAPDADAVTAQQFLDPIAVVCGSCVIVKAVHFPVL